jgi:hypothetical protein
MNVSPFTIALIITFIICQFTTFIINILSEKCFPFQQIYNENTNYTIICHNNENCLINFCLSNISKADKFLITSTLNPNYCEINNFNNSLNIATLCFFIGEIIISFIWFLLAKFEKPSTRGVCYIAIGYYGLFILLLILWDGLVNYQLEKWKFIVLFIDKLILFSSLLCLVVKSVDKDNENR